jgi:phage terminase large subunit
VAVPSAAIIAKAKALKIKKQRMEPAYSSDSSQGSFKDFVRYQADPVTFGEVVLGEHYTDPIKEVMRSVRDNPVTIAVSANATGKSHSAARIALWFYLVFPESQVYTTAAPPERNLRKILWGEIGHLTSRRQDLFPESAVSSGMNIQAGPQHFIAGVSIPMAGTPEQREAKFSGKHAPDMLFIVDEADAVPPEVFKGIEACMSGGNTRMLLMFNPRSEVGTVSGMVKRGEGNVIHLSAFDHPNVITGENVIPGAVSREKTVRRINEWTRPLAPHEDVDIECFEVPSFLVGAVAKSQGNVEYAPLPTGWRRVTNPAFFYMVLGRYPPKSDTRLISRIWVDAAVSRWLTYVAKYGEKPPPTVTPIIGLDVADMGKDTNQITFRYGGWVPKQEGWAGIDPDATAIKAHGIIRELGLRAEEVNVLVDATGVGAGVAPRMKRLGCSKADGVMVASSPTYESELGKFFQLRDQLWWSVMVWLRNDPGAMIPPDEDLIEELVTPSYGIRGGKIRVSDKDTMKKLLGRSPDRAESLMLTFAPLPELVGAWR